MIGISASGATYNSSDPWDNVRITSSTTNFAQKECANLDGTLNSNKVINKFKKKLEEVREYSHSDIHKSGEAVVLNLKTKVWSFDIVPCFHTVVESIKGTFIVTKTGFCPIKVKLELFFKWGIEFEKEPYIVPIRDNSTEKYACLRIPSTKGR
jgi:hypothetical protein